MTKKTVVKAKKTLTKKTVAKPSGKEKELHLQAVTNLGTSMQQLVEHYTNPTALGIMIDKALLAAVKADYPGRQKTKHVEKALATARKAISRSFRRTLQRHPAGGVGVGVGVTTAETSTDSITAPIEMPFSTAGSAADSRGIQ